MLKLRLTLDPWRGTRTGMELAGCLGGNLPAALAVVSYETLERLRVAAHGSGLLLSWCPCCQHPSHTNLWHSPQLNSLLVERLQSEFSQ